MAAAEKIRDISTGRAGTTLHSLARRRPRLNGAVRRTHFKSIPRDFGEIREDWGSRLGRRTISSLEGKIVCAFTVWATSSATVSGSRMRWVCCAGKLALKACICRLHWPTEGYNLPAINRSLRMGNCLSAALDETNQYGLSDERIRTGVNKFSAKWPNAAPEALLAVFPSRPEPRLHAVPSVLADIGCCNSIPTQLTPFRFFHAIPPPAINADDVQTLRVNATPSRSSVTGADARASVLPLPT